jgi:hypothetical protein
MECYFGDPEEDLVRTVFDHGSRLSLTTATSAGPGPGDANTPWPAAFVAAYVEQRPPRPGFRQRYVINMLRDCLLIWNFRSRNALPREGETFRAWAEPFVPSTHSRNRDSSPSHEGPILRHEGSGHPVSHPRPIAQILRLAFSRLRHRFRLTSRSHRPIERT